MRQLSIYIFVYLKRYFYFLRCLWSVGNATMLGRGKTSIQIYWCDSTECTEMVDLHKPWPRLLELKNVCKGAICKNGHMFNSHFVTVDPVDGAFHCKLEFPCLYSWLPILKLSCAIALKNGSSLQTGVRIASVLLHNQLQQLIKQVKHFKKDRSCFLKHTIEDCTEHRSTERNWKWQLQIVFTAPLTN